MSCCTYDCIDAGTENCPCYLALTGDCLTCSRLAGCDDCDCSWKGVCIYNEFKQGNGKVNNPRTDREVEIADKTYYMDDLVVFILNVGKGFALKASRPGSYIFMRRKEEKHYYDLPISIMKADVEKGQIHVAVKTISLKTKNLADCQDTVMIRGVYRNGLQGAKYLTDKKTVNKKILIIAKGVGIAPGMLSADYLCIKNRVDLLIDRTKISEELISDYLVSEEGLVKYIHLENEEERSEIPELLKREKYDAVVVLSSDYFLKTIGQMVRETLPDSNLSLSNNFKLCCGEGICGSCSVIDDNGCTIKMCKCQLPGVEALDMIKL